LKSKGLSKTKFYYYLSCILFCGIYFGADSQAKVEIAFLKKIDPKTGQYVRFQLHGPGFYHVAIKIGSQWLHAHPWGGVQLSDDLSLFGEVTVILVSEKIADIKKIEIEKYLNMQYDNAFNWGDKRYYCSELVAILLDIKPRIMRFDMPTWNHYFESLGMPQQPEGVGISPDDLFEELKTNGFRVSQKHCEL
jgi:hypothetical protein